MNVLVMTYAVGLASASLYGAILVPLLNWCLCKTHVYYLDTESA